jgi:Flp pilus assembly protein TadB
MNGKRNTSQSDPVASGTVPLPSADLINYRFDQTDKKFEEMFTKMDNLGTSYLTKEEATAKRAEVEGRLKDHDDRLNHLESMADQQSGAITLLKLLLILLTAVCTVLGTVLGVRHHL